MTFKNPLDLKSVLTLAVASFFSCSPLNEIGFPSVVFLTHYVAKF